MSITRVWLKIDGFNVQRTTHNDPAGVEYVAAEHYNELLEWLQDFSTQNKCGCGHPACKSCRREEEKNSFLERYRAHLDEELKEYLEKNSPHPLSASPLKKEATHAD